VCKHFRFVVIRAMRQESQFLNLKAMVNKMYDSELVYDTSRCSSQGFSWSPSNRYLNRSKLASTRLCNNHIIIIAPVDDVGLQAAEYLPRVHNSGDNGGDAILPTFRSHKSRQDLGTDL